MKSTQPASMRPAWEALVTHHAQIGGTHLRELFAADAQRGAHFTVDAAGPYLDFSKNRIDDETRALLAALAHDCGLNERIAAMFRGDAIMNRPGN